VETFAVDNDSREPTWNEKLTKIQHFEAKIAQHLSGVDKAERRELGFAIQTLQPLSWRGLWMRMWPPSGVINRAGSISKRRG
jgi:hypothetical protein